VKFTEAGVVEIVIRTPAPADADDAAGDAGFVEVEVRDTGSGIAPEELPRVFDRFYRADAARERSGGTGLGLTICKNLLDLMHGRITLESTVGTGTTVTFWIPFSKPHGQQDSSLAQSGAIPDRLQSELSLSCNSSEYEQVAGAATGPDGSSVSSVPRRRLSVRTPPGIERELPRAERAKMHVLVVEDK